MCVLPCHRLLAKIWLSESSGCCEDTRTRLSQLENWGAGRILAQCQQAKAFSGEQLTRVVHHRALWRKQLGARDSYSWRLCCHQAVGKTNASLRLSLGWALIGKSNSDPLRKAQFPQSRVKHGSSHTPRCSSSLKKWKESV